MGLFFNAREKIINKFGSTVFLIQNTRPEQVPCKSAKPTLDKAPEPAPEPSLEPTFEQALEPTPEKTPKRAPNSKLFDTPKTTKTKRKTSPLNLREKYLNKIENKEKNTNN